MDTLSRTGEEEYNTDQRRRRPKKFRKTTSSSSNCMESLPADVILEILLRVPAQDIHNSARLVCREWYKIINNLDFKHAHLQKSTFGLLAQGSKGTHQHTTFIAAAEDLIETSKLSYRPLHSVSSSCNGLLLDDRYIYISNPATKQKLDLPPFFSNPRGSAIAYVAATMEYKVILASDLHLAILTVGVDKDWTRSVNTQHISRKAKELIKTQQPLTTQGFVHWAQSDDREVNWAGYVRKYKRRSGHVLTLNVETEIITQFPIPSLCSHDIGFKTEVIYLPMGSYLSLLILRSKFSWEFWAMKPETGEWTEMLIIDLEDQFVSSKNYVLKPVGWLRPREVLVFSVGERMGSWRFESYFFRPFCFVFNVRTRKLQRFTLDSGINRYHVHRNSLLWINGC